MYEEMAEEWQEWLELTPLERFDKASRFSPSTLRWEAALIPARSDESFLRGLRVDVMARLRDNTPSSVEIGHSMKTRPSGKRSYSRRPISNWKLP